MYGKSSLFLGTYVYGLQSFKEARCNKLIVANIWLDISNAYVAVLHRHIFFAFDRYGAHEHWISLIKAYSSGIFGQSFSSFAPSS